MTRAYSRKTKKDIAEESAKLGLIKKRLLNEEEASIYIGLSVGTLRELRLNAPKKFTAEKVKEYIENRELFTPPVTYEGTKVVYDVKLLDKWTDLLPQMGMLPESETA